MAITGNTIYGGTLIMLCLLIIVMVLRQCPDDIVQEFTDCPKEVEFAISPDRDTFQLGELIELENNVLNINYVKWVTTGGGDSIIAGADYLHTLSLIYKEPGDKEIFIRYNRRLDCEFSVRKIYIRTESESTKPTCEDGIKNGEETGIDCGGNCNPCDEPNCFDGMKNGNETGVDCGGNCNPCKKKPSCNDGIKNGYETGVDCGGHCDPCESGNSGTPPPVRIVHTGGDLKCNEMVSFDCGISNYDVNWSFDENRTILGGGKTVSHKFRTAGEYVVRVYIGTQEVGQKRIRIGTCAGGTGVAAGGTTGGAQIVLPQIKCNEQLGFRVSSTGYTGNLRWVLNNAQSYTGSSAQYSFSKSGTNTISVYSGNSSTPLDTKTFTVNCSGGGSSSFGGAEISEDNYLKDKLQDIVTTGRKALSLVTRSGKKYKRVIDNRLSCKRGATIVKINDKDETSFANYFDEIANHSKFNVTAVRVQKKGDCIEKIFVTQVRK